MALSYSLALEKLSQSGVVNIEMESTTFASLTNQANIRAAVVCVTLLNRMEGDQIDSPPARLKDYDTRPQILIARYIRKAMYGEPPAEDSSYTCDCSGDQN